MAPEFYIIRTFFIGFCMGIGLFIVLHGRNTSPPHKFSENCVKADHKINETRMRNYERWFREVGIGKHILNSDELRYSDINGESESEWLYRKVSIVCVVYTSNSKSALAINETWSKSCNEVIFYSKNLDNNKHTIPIGKSNATSSFHLLCNVLNKIVKEYPHAQWALFVKDDMFVIPENLRYLVAPLNPHEGHYLGHPISFWGVEYNMALAGFALSAGAMRRIVDMFPNSTACISGGKYWKQEDLYLGKHLRSLGIHPVDTRDDTGFSLFIGYDLDKMMFPGSTQQFTIYNTRALYPPVKCCGSKIVTFPVLSYTEMYTYHNMIYKLRIFVEGSRGNRPAPTVIPEVQVWQNFLREEGLALDSSDAQYEQSWYIKFGNVTAIPGILEMKSRKRPAVGGPNKLFNPTNMPEVLEDMLSNYTARKALHNIRS